MRFPAFLLVAALASGAQSAAAQTVEFARAPSGFEYKLFRKDAAGKYQPRPLAPAGDAPYASRTGQFMTVHLDYRTGRDSLLMSSRQQSKLPQPLPLPAEPPKGGIEEAMSYLLPGDSAVFRFNADSVFAKTFRQPVPPFIRRGGNALLIRARAYELLSPDQMQARQQQLQADAEAKAKADAAQRLAQDDAAIRAYLKKNKLTANKTAGGTYYIVTKPVAGQLPKKGQTVSVRYKGSILSTGAVFDASERHGNTPFDFTLGQGQVIQGWDQGIGMLTKGSKGILLIPSPLGYGARGAGGDIPPNAILKFEVELVDVK